MLHYGNVEEGTDLFMKGDVGGLVLIRRHDKLGILRRLKPHQKKDDQELSQDCLMVWGV